MSRRTGARHPNAKLTQEEADEIRVSRMTCSELGRLYGVSKATVSLIKNNKVWAQNGEELTPPRPENAAPGQPEPPKKRRAYPSAEEKPLL